MADAHFENPRLAALYDPLDPDRRDLHVYAAMVTEFGCESILDVGCGTGSLACLLARAGIDVVAADPARASLAVAQRKPGADRVRWLLADAAHVPALGVDGATMTGNVAQVFVTDAGWVAALRGVHAALRPGGRLIFETRDPARQAWLEWNRERTYRRVTFAGIGEVETWVEVRGAGESLVSFRTTYVFGSDGAVLTSDSTLRFRTRAELTDSLADAGFAVEEVRDAPDRPGLEFVFVARRPG